jgi:hypothetical protein
MQPHQQRVIDEYNALNDKAKALYMFFTNKIFESLDEDEQDLLKMQYYSMMVYAGILQKRIAKF